MGSSEKSQKPSTGASEKAMVTIETTNLKQRLNDAFVNLHGKGSPSSMHDANFDRLWDLKESAILEGKNTVELPGQWLSELDEIETTKQRH